jgi:eukaryotic-like serine/threonine-protein kinase
MQQWPPLPNNNTTSNTQLIAGRYQLSKSLGSGGLGEVYFAHDTKYTPPRPVALKLVNPHLLSDPNMVEQILQEAGAMAQFSHPNILRVLDYEIKPDIAYIVTEYAEGGSLKERIKKEAGNYRTFPLEKISDMLSKIATALDAAHRNGFIHRDIKPQNILLDKYDNPLLADFSLAVAQPSNYHFEMVKADAWGTPEYAAPEVWQGKVGKASDVYALGAILYEMLTGQTPFRDGTGKTLEEMHTTSGVPPLRQKIPNLSGTNRLHQVIETAMAKDATNRYHSATALYEDFKKAVETSTRARRHPLKINFKQILFYIIVGLVVFIIVLGFFSNPPNNSRTVIVTPVSVRLTPTPTVNSTLPVRQPDFSLNGHTGEVGDVAWCQSGLAIPMV